MRNPHSDRKLYGCLTRRERWGLSWRGRFALILLMIVVGGTWMRCVHPFLAITHRVNSRILVVEGWTSPYVLFQLAVDAFDLPFMRKALLGIKARAEALAASEAGAASEAAATSAQARTARESG